MIRYLLDTNILSEVVKPVPDINVIRLLEFHKKSVATAAPVWQELVFGCRRLPFSKRRSSIEKFLFDHLKPKIPILPYDESAALWHADERARLESLGKTPPFVDGQIAAIAGANQLTLITRNVQDFESFVGLRLGFAAGQLALGQEARGRKVTYPTTTTSKRLLASKHLAELVQGQVAKALVSCTGRAGVPRGFR